MQLCYLPRDWVSSLLGAVTVAEVVAAIRKAPECFQTCQVLQREMDKCEPNGAVALAEVILKE